MLPGFMLIRSDPEPIVGRLFFPPFAPLLPGFMLVGMILS